MCRLSLVYVKILKRATIAKNQLLEKITVQTFTYECKTANLGLIGVRSLRVLSSELKPSTFCFKLTLR